MTEVQKGKEIICTLVSLYLLNFVPYAQKLQIQKSTKTFNEEKVRKMSSIEKAIEIVEQIDQVPNEG